MKIRNASGLLACMLLLLASTLLSGCGGSSSNKTIPSSTTTYYAHSLVFRNNSAMTTGYNGFGQLGIGNLDNQSTLVKVVGLGHVDRAATGGDHTLAVSFANTSTVYAWGSNYHGQIGPAKVTTGTDAYSPVPVTVHGLHPVSQPAGTVREIAAGAFHSLAVVDLPNNPGTVWAWGYNGYGQLGNSLFDDSSIPVQVVVGTQKTPLNHIVKVAAGGSHSLALTDDGRVYSWGNNAYGQLGRTPTQPGGGVNDATAELVMIDDGAGNLTPLTGVKQIVTGGSTCYALVDRGKMYTWGYNGSGQLGLDPTVAANLFKVVPQFQNYSTLTAPLKIEQLSAGLEHVLARAGDKVWSWGFNGFGQVGVNVTPNSSDPVGLGINRFYIPQKVLFGGNAEQTPILQIDQVTDIIAFGNHSLALRAGKWYGWGNNGTGELGAPIATSSIGYLLLPTLVGGQ